MKEIKGDLIQLAQKGEFDVIVHGCNCMCAMGAGIAKTIKEIFPAAYEADLKTVKGDRDKLGTCTAADVKLSKESILTIINAYTQYDWKGEGVLADYEAIKCCFKWIKVNYSGKRIGIPKIGAGLAKGDWGIISTVISEALENEDITVVIRD